MMDYLEGKECINFGGKLESAIIIEYKCISLLLTIKLYPESMYLSKISLLILVKYPKLWPYPVWIPHPRRVDTGAAPKVKSPPT